MDPNADMQALAELARRVEALIDGDVDALEAAEQSGVDELTARGERLSVLRDGLSGILRDLAELARGEVGPRLETREHFLARVIERTGVDAAQIPPGVPDDLAGGSIIARCRTGPGQQDEYVVTHGYPDAHFPDRWTRPESYRLVTM